MPGDLRVACRHPRQQLGVVQERPVELDVEVVVQDVMHGSSDSLARATKAACLAEQYGRRGADRGGCEMQSSYLGMFLPDFISRTEKNTKPFRLS